ncbi:hypothetical protein HYZ99_03450 [Candidatus Peregrinibacteria bacterium]|nr:hypothetical protein [Candidatus Peregrinibacteria bacterium]
MEEKFCGWRMERECGAIRSQNRVARFAHQPRTSQLVVSGRQNHNRFPRTLVRRLKIGGSRRAATVSVRTARETGKARRHELGGSPAAKFSTNKFCTLFLIVAKPKEGHPLLEVES